jgi:hypothetical protein
MTKVILQSVLAVVIGSAGYWMGAAVERRQSEEVDRSILVLSDAAELSFYLALNEELATCACSQIDTLINRKINTKLSVLNSYPIREFGSAGNILRKDLRNLLKERKREGAEVGAIKLLLSRLEK